MKNIINSVILWLFACCVKNSICARTKEKIYVDVEGYNACIRRLNGTHQIGCSTGRKGNVGVLHYVENQTDVDWMINDGPHEPYIILLTPRMFNREIVDRLESSGKVNGMLVIHTNATEDYPEEFSPESTCPNEHSDLYASDPDYAHCKNVSWNPDGNQLFFEDHDFPIMVLTNVTEVDAMISNCYRKYNKPSLNGDAREYPLCAVEIKDAMDAAVDTPTCIRRNQMITNLNPQTYCDPFGGYNVFGFMQPASAEEMEDKSLIIAASRIDSFSLFEQIYPSVDNPISSMVTLLAVAEALGKVKNDFINVSHPLMFAFLDGEAFDYTGSVRMIYDMENGKFPKNANDNDGPQPITPQKIHSVLEISQVGKHTETGYKVYMHTDPLSRRNVEVDNEVQELLASIETIAADVTLNIEEAPEIQPLPPASFQSFLKKGNISGVVISDHQTSYKNKYYNSIYDRPANIKADYPDGLTEDEKYNYVTEAASNLTRVATVMARTLYNLSVGSNTSAIVANETIVANLLYCFTHSPICELFNFTLDSHLATHISKELMVHYVGVSGQSSVVSEVTQHLLSYFLGDVVALTPELCGDKTGKDCCEDKDEHKNDKFYDYQYVNGPLSNTTENEREGLCIKSVAYGTDGSSPAFMDGYDWESNQYPAWTESRWAVDGIYVRYFLVPPLDMEVTTLCVGIVILLCSFPLVYIIDKRASLLFSEPGIL